MKTSTKLKSFLIIFFIAIFAVIAARYFIGQHFKKKFSNRPPPGVIVTKVEKSFFYKSIETFGTAIAENSKTYRVKKDDVVGNLNIENRFVKKDEIIIALKDGENIIADFEGKLGKREIAQGVLGSNSLIITLDDLKKIIIDIKVPENYVGVLKPGLKAEIINSAFNKTFKGKVESISSRIDPSTRSILARIVVDNPEFKIIPGQLMTVKVIYDERKIHMNDLLKIFWESHNPTQQNRQGNDIGTQYRSIILTDKKDLISNLEKSKEKFQKILTSKSLGTIHTEIRILENFFVAEDYHQKYLHKNPNGYCGLKGLEVNYL